MTSLRDDVVTTGSLLERRLHVQQILRDNTDMMGMMFVCVYVRVCVCVCVCV